MVGLAPAVSTARGPTLERTVVASQSLSRSVAQPAEARGAGAPPRSRGWPAAGPAPVIRRGRHGRLRRPRRWLGGTLRLGIDRERATELAADAAPDAAAHALGRLEEILTTPGTPASRDERERCGVVHYQPPVRVRDREADCNGRARAHDCDNNAALVARGAIEGVAAMAAPTHLWRIVPCGAHRAPSCHVG